MKIKYLNFQARISFIDIVMFTKGSEVGISLKTMELILGNQNPDAMKKILLSLMIIFTYTCTMAQEDVNKMWLGGTINYSSYTDDDDDDQTDLTIGPSFGYCINDKLAVGITISYSSSEENNLSNTMFGIMPFFRYYQKLNDNFSVYGALNVGFASGSDEVNVGTEVVDDEYGYFNVGVAPGIQYWFAKSWSVNAEWGILGYQTYTDKKDDVTPEEWKASQFSFGLDMSAITFGLNFHF